MPSKESVYKVTPMHRRNHEVAIGVGAVVLFISLVLCILGPSALFGPVAQAPGFRFYYAAAPLILVVTSLGVIAASVTALQKANYDAPVLVFNDQRITDSREQAAPRQIDWTQIQSMDAEMRSSNGRTFGGQLYLYVRTSDGRIEEVTVNLGGLDVEPMKLAREAKRRWLEATQGQFGATPELDTPSTAIRPE